MWRFAEPLFHQLNGSVEFHQDECRRPAGGVEENPGAHLRRAASPILRGAISGSAAAPTPNVDAPDLGGRSRKRPRRLPTPGGPGSTGRRIRRQSNRSSTLPLAQRFRLIKKSRTAPSERGYSPVVTLHVIRNNRVLDLRATASRLERIAKTLPTDVQQPVEEVAQILRQHAKQLSSERARDIHANKRVDQD